MCRKMTRFVVCLATTVGLSLVFPGFVSAEEFAVWEFDDGVSTWIANGQTRLNASGGVLTVVSAGCDPAQGGV